MSELLDFQSRENFNFFKYSCYMSEEKKQGFLTDCQRILEYAHETVRDMCILGYRLKELKGTLLWREVFEPESNICFSYDRFEDFCGYAFGFSKTKVSNLLNIAEFVKMNGENIDFIDKKYAGYNTSQLVELGSVSEIDRHCFSPKQTVAEMRLIKKLLNTVSCGWWTPEEALREAKRRAEEKQQPSRKQGPGEIIPGQITFAGLTGEADAAGRKEKFSETAADSESDVGIESKVEESEVSDVGQIEESESEAEKFNLKNRAGRRQWLSSYTEWESQYNRGYYPLYERVYHYNLKTGEVVYASETHVCKDVEKMTSYDAPRYYLKTEQYEYPIQVTKEQIEEYLTERTEEV